MLCTKPLLQNTWVVLWLSSSTALGSTFPFSRQLEYANWQKMDDDPLLPLLPLLLLLDCLDLPLSDLLSFPPLDRLDQLDLPPDLPPPDRLA